MPVGSTKDSYGNNCCNRQTPFCASFRYRASRKFHPFYFNLISPKRRNYIKWCLLINREKQKYLWGGYQKIVATMSCDNYFYASAR
ncbi:hypothetical protein HZH66_013085 [Vespula vulgaris]|uniref:Uncharacterized protein n=1 Tax=Vespula vulgaris TaxID=7454 RepID=A0A834MTS8_VESVU|nr:hypothetical protein HZH66_013085 [Vespula vulgaris]